MRLNEAGPQKALPLTDVRTGITRTETLSDFDRNGFEITKGSGYSLLNPVPAVAVNAIEPHDVALALTPFKFSVIGRRAGSLPSVPNGSFYSVAFETKISSNLYPGGSYWAHNKAANTALDAAIKSDPVFARSMSDLGISIPRSGTGSILGKSPTNWTWHHDVSPGVLQLVPKAQHPNNLGGIFWEVLHPEGAGGMSRWNR